MAASAFVGTNTTDEPIRPYLAGTVRIRDQYDGRTDSSLPRRHGKNQHRQDCQDEACDQRKQGVERMGMEMAIARSPEVLQGPHDQPPATIKQQTICRSLPRFPCLN
ncbi:hypothetical protein SBA7_30007 [Candidatus Sulfotelmatobacter sp. SbA7]|nr:hypothetical protein SBA7_30007 [Candidatus Sulfotelmatobacter sp. SbA7]